MTRRKWFSQIRRRIVTPFCALVVLVATVSDAPARAQSEDQVKAAFLFNFARYVEWPDDAFSDARSPVRICTIGADEFGSVVSAVVEGKSVGDRTVSVEQVPDVVSAESCHILYAGSEAEASSDEIVAGLSNASVFTIADTEGFADKGGIANFFRANNKIRFEINPKAARGAGLKISSRLLRLARVVELGGGGGHAHFLRCTLAGPLSGRARPMNRIDVGRDSIQRRIVRGFFGTTALVLALTSSALFATAFFEFRGTTDRSLTALARVIGGNSEASLLFDDAQAASETLSALKAEERIEGAIVYSDDGRVFAEYVRGDVVDFHPPRELSFEPVWSRHHIDLAAKIMLGKEQIGTVFIRSDTKDVTSFLINAMGIVVGVLLLSAFLCWWGAARLRSQIADPLSLLVDGSAAMAAGDLSTEVEFDSEDEMGVLARAFNVMVLSLRGLVSRVRENSRYVADATSRLAAASSAMQEEVTRQEQAVEATAESVGRITSSMHAVNNSVEALSETALETSSAAIEMDSSIAETGTHIDELSEIIESTSSSVVEMTSGIREIARSADTLNNATESTAQALELLSGSVRQVETNAQESHELSSDTAEKAERGMSAVHETVEGMHAIQDFFEGIEGIISNLSEKSESIGAVVKVIESVVEQTNLLALNAAIISSQAGEHGRAFSVVAEEVRSLAERTAASTREIAELIESVQSGVHSAVAEMGQGATRVERGVTLSNQAGRMLREIGESAEQSRHRAKEIVEATRGQAADIDQVGIAMTQVNEIATQLGRGTHEQDSAGAEITRGVEQMRHLGLEVKSAAQEQRRESSLITQSVEIVALKIKEISLETKDQSKRADQIQEALQVFREVTERSTQRAQETRDTVGDLSARAQGLEEEVGRFRL